MREILDSIEERRSLGSIEEEEEEEGELSVSTRGSEKRNGEVWEKAVELDEGGTRGRE